ncbi:MAG: response regulator transcription factor [Chloroflexi bacterium]|nr:response regulator transcription factor [Chloroflexota bacterium]
MLVAEDEERVLRFMALKLKASGYDVLMAKDGAEALEQVRAQPLDLIVLDLAMPRKDGFETLIELRSFSRLPVIVVTALETDESAVLDLGADDYLSKPFNPRELVDRIKALL